MSPTVNVFNRFRVILALTSVLLLENQEDVKRLIRDLASEDQEEILGVLAQRRRL